MQLWSIKPERFALKRIMNQESRIKKIKNKVSRLIHNSLFMIRKSRGFTLIELLIAISIIGILSSFLLANFVGARQRARDGVRKSDLRQIQAALELYRSDQAAYPATDDFPECGSPLQDSSSPPVVYMKKIPCDPSTDEVYTYSSDTLTYSIIACLENESDSQKDATNVDPCDGTSEFSYTLENP